MKDAIKNNKAHYITRAMIAGEQALVTNSKQTHDKTPPAKTLRYIIDENWQMKKLP